jgi:hypothetical protein
VGVLWSSIDQDLDRTKQALQYHRTEFEAEALLASTRATAQWQDEVWSKLNSKLPADDTAAKILMIPHSKNTMFYGRDEYLQELKTHLNDRIPEESDSLRSVALTGMGGVGKTQIALEYAYRYRDLFSHQFWLYAENEVSLAESFASIATALGCSHRSGNLQKNIEIVRDWLNKTCEICRYILMALLIYC